MSTPSRWVVLDDKDPAITYQGSGWFEDSGSKNNVGNFGAPYLSTLHGSSSDGSVSFSFNGTAISVDGTNIVANAKTNPDPNFECFIDNISIGREDPFEFGENNWGLCRASNLSPGPHTLRVDVKVADPKNPFWLDKILYIPTPDVNLEGKVIMIDQTDPAVRFDARWKGLGDTARMTTTTGSVVQIDFIGESVTWISFIPTELPHAGATGSWYLDSDSDKPTQFLLAGIPSQNSPTQYHQVFFTSPKVSQGRHTLTVTFLGSGKTTPLSLDYLYIQNGTSPASSSGSGSGANDNQGSNQPGNESSSSTPLGAILGGVLGGLGLLVIIVTGIFLYRRHQAKKDRISLVDDNHEYKYTPFNVNGDSHHTLGNAGTMDHNNISSTWTSGIATGSVPNLSAGDSSSNLNPTAGSGYNTPSQPTLLPPAIAPMQQQQQLLVPAFRKHREAIQSSNSRTNRSQPMYQVPYVLTHNAPSSVVPTDDVATSPSVASGPSGWPGSKTIQHSDSGMRLADPADVIIEEVPPHYTPN